MQNPRLSHVSPPNKRPPVEARPPCCHLAMSMQFECVASRIHNIPARSVRALRRNSVVSTLLSTAEDFWLRKTNSPMTAQLKGAGDRVVSI